MHEMEEVGEVLKDALYDRNMCAWDIFLLFSPFRGNVGDMIVKD